MVLVSRSTMPIIIPENSLACTQEKLIVLDCTQ
jgi:hypothetical protein